MRDRQRRRRRLLIALAALAGQIIVVATITLIIVWLCLVHADQSQTIWLPFIASQLRLIGIPTAVLIGVWIAMTLSDKRVITVLIVMTAWLLFADAVVLLLWSFRPYVRVPGGLTEWTAHQYGSDLRGAALLTVQITLFSLIGIPLGNILRRTYTSAHMQFVQKARHRRRRHCSNVQRTSRRG